MCTLFTGFERIRIRAKIRQKIISGTKKPDIVASSPEDKEPIPAGMRTRHHMPDYASITWSICIPDLTFGLMPYIPDLRVYIPDSNGIHS